MAIFKVSSRESVSAVELLVIVQEVVDDEIDLAGRKPKEKPRARR